MEVNTETHQLIFKFCQSLLEEYRARRGMDLSDFANCIVAVNSLF
jgi:hypothetical protein